MLYVPDHFAASEAAAFDLIDAHPFGDLVVAGEDGPMIAPAPFLLDRAARALRVHVARANPIWRPLAAAGVATAWFRGPHTYVSPTFYADRAQAPTWNYQAAALRGPARILEGEELRALLADVTERFEIEGRAAPSRGPLWRMTDMSERALKGLERGLVGLEITVERVCGKAKLSQNRAEADRLGVIAALEGGHDDDRAVADAMRALER